MFRRRETMIALRARHQAMEVTREIAYPPLEVPPPPQQVIPLRPDLSSPPSTPDWWMPDDDHDDVRPWRSVYVPEYAQEVPRPRSMLVDVLLSDVVLGLLMILIGFAVVLMCKYG